MRGVLLACEGGGVGCFTSSSSSALDGCVMYTLSPAVINWVVLHRSSSDPARARCPEWCWFALSGEAAGRGVGMPAERVQASGLVTQLVEEWACLQDVFRRLVSLAAVAES